MPRKKRLADGFPARLRQARKQKGLTLQQTADAIGLGTRAAVSSMERTTPAGLKGVEDLAAALGVRPAWLAYGDGEP